MLRAALQRSRQLGPGDKLGKYEVIRQIAIGGMAELYLARTVGIEGFEKLVVLKRILPQYVANTSFVNMFLNEARLAATLHHPNIAQVYDIGLEHGDYFFAMEYVHGEDLDHMAIAAEEQGVPISLDASLTLVAGLCAGLHYAHERVTAEGKPLQIVHRDVSPSNVLVSYDGAVKLVDFGIARATSRPGTTPGGLKGKIAYMSPEQCKQKAQLDRRSDLYSVGTILYQLTTGQLPFSGETEYQILNQIVNDDPPPPSAIVPGYQPQLERIVMRALARDPAHRFATALELQSAVEDFAHDSRLRVSPLVLARLMGTLFPARLEEWDHAKAQGAFFVEQHVVRTLIESGKTPAPGAAAENDDRTVNQAIVDLVGDTTAGALPLTTTDTTVNATPLQIGDVTEITTAPPPPPGLARMSSFPAIASGTLVSSSSSPRIAIAPDELAGHVDASERVRVPVKRHPSPTMFVRAAPSRTSLYVVIGALAIAGGLAAFIALRDPGPARPAQSSAARDEAGDAPPTAPAARAGDESTAIESADADSTDESADADSAEESTAAVAGAEPVEPTDVAGPTPAKVDRRVVKAQNKRQTRPQVTTKKPVARTEKTTEKTKAGVKADAAPETWNADSPFMPVRTEKK